MVTITFSNEDFTKFLDALNNALILYKDDTSARLLGCASNNKLHGISEEVQKERYEFLSECYIQFLQREKEMKNSG